ncbi:MAG: hypothetical protein HKN52_00020 [Eudoraea sp.]|nr:hypothetical protein [Eudoraea sp.]
MAIPVLQAQYGPTYGAMGRRQSVVPQSQEPRQKAEPLTADQIVANEMPKITEALELNDFEQAVVSSILTKYVQQRIELQILGLEPEKMKEATDLIRTRQNEELKAGLPEDKYKALQELQENGFKKKKTKKKKKKKDKS